MVFGLSSRKKLTPSPSDHLPAIGTLIESPKKTSVDLISKINRVVS